jgi:hypothetical protein
MSHRVVLKKFLLSNLELLLAVALFLQGEFMPPSLQVEETSCIVVHVVILGDIVRKMALQRK